MKQKLILGLPILTLLMTAVTGCHLGRKEGGEEDDGMAHVTVATLDKGIGMTWLTNAASMFEELYKDRTDFEEGKVGVKVDVSGSTGIDGDYIQNSNLNKDIYFTEGIPYRELVQRGDKFLDITDVVTEKLTTYDDNRSVEDKLDPGMKDYLNVDGKYYGIPFYDSFYGLVYDVTLWNEKGLYLSKSNTFVRKNGDLSLGCDGVAGTLDDGLPSTYEEFRLLIQKIRDFSIKPFVCSTNGIEYTANYLYNVLADYEGLDNMNLTTTLNGTANDLVAENGLTLNADGSVQNVTFKPATTINNDNGYELTRQLGKYQALHFMGDILMSSADNYKIEATHTTAQTSFVYGKQNGSGKTVAMIIEGSWWENEAANTLKNYEETYGERSDYAIMPIPFADETKAEQCNRKHTYLSLSQSFGVVSSSSQHVKLAKEFMRFLHSDKMLSKFTADTSITRPLNYDISAEDQNHLSTYAKSLIDLKKNSDIFYPYTSNQFMMDNLTYFTAFNFTWNSRFKVGDEDKFYRHPCMYFTADIKEGHFPIKYFDGQYDYFKKQWSAMSR